MVSLELEEKEIMLLIQLLENSNVPIKVAREAISVLDKLKEKLK